MAQPEVEQVRTAPAVMVPILGAGLAVRASLGELLSPARHRAAVVVVLPAAHQEVARAVKSPLPIREV